MLYIEMDVLDFQYIYISEFRVYTKQTNKGIYRYL